MDDRMYAVKLIAIIIAGLVAAFFWLTLGQWWVFWAGKWVFLNWGPDL